VPYGTDFRLNGFQAFHAWLPSRRPSGTNPTLSVYRIGVALVTVRFVTWIPRAFGPCT